MGIGTTREMDRVLAAVGKLQQADPIFVPANNVCNAGVLLLLPALIAQGLLKGVEVYGTLKKGYYGLLSILLLLGFMALSRIKTPEQLKNCKPGELGKILGLDRVPEARCLRYKIQQIVSHKKANEFNHAVSELWISEQDKELLFYYVDGRVRVYHGNKATLTKRFVSREKLCLAGTTDYWINNEMGLPYLVVTGELNEKLQTIILNEVVAELLRDTEKIINPDVLENNPKQARFVLVFDREAYDSGFFKLLWEKYRIAIVTYKKNVKDKWDESEFQECSATVIGKTVSLRLQEKLKTESRLFMNVVRMIAFRAETAVVNLLGDYYAKVMNEGRMLVKEIVKTDADLEPDYKSKTLTVRLHSLSTQRANKAVEQLCQLLNETETIFPGTELRLIYQTLSSGGAQAG
ncbi:MAG: hypothetical protein JW915_00245 [Chitinispirillaceae bacterium]|nr:hypothetical protein [Chitinispirillaceae bacterium]